MNDNYNLGNTSGNNEQSISEPEITDETLIQTQNEIASLKKYRAQLQAQPELFAEDSSQVFNSQQGMASGAGAVKGNSLVKTDNSGIKYIDPDNPMHPSGFVNKLIVALLAGFGLGVITTAIYIFIGLGHVNVSL